MSNQTITKTNKTIISCITGVRDPQTLSHYQKSLESLGLTYCQNFLHQTGLLIAASPLTEKYKVTMPIYADLEVIQQRNSLCECQMA